MSLLSICLNVLLAISVLLAPAAARSAGPEVQPAGKPRAVILLDVSFLVILSLEEPNPSERPARLLCEQLGDVVLITFSDSAYVAPQAIGDFRRQELKAALHPTVAPGLEADYIVGLDATAGVDPTVPVILVTIGEVPKQRRRVIDYYRRSGRLVHVVGWERKPEEREFMRQLAAATGGRYFAARNVNDLIRLFTDVPPALRIVAAEGHQTAGLSHPIRVEFTELGQPLEEGWFAHYGVARASVAGELRLLDGRGQILERKRIPPPVRGPSAELTVALPDNSGPYTLEARATLGRFSVEARAHLYAESVCKPVLLPHLDLGTLEWDRLLATVPFVTDSRYRCDYSFTVSDLEEAGGRVVPLNLTKQADFTRANEGAADPGPKSTVDAKEVLGAHALARLQGPGKVALVAGPSRGHTRLPPGVYKATLTVALKHAPQRRSSTTLTLTVPEPPPPPPPEPTPPPPAADPREQRKAALAQLKRQLEAERRTRAEERREAEKGATSAENAIGEQATRQLYLVILLIALTPLACYGCVAVWKWIWASVEPPRRDARAAVAPGPATPEEDIEEIVDFEEILPTFDDFAEEGEGQFEAPPAGSRTSRQSFGR